jgi:polar amino acid transport system substrate-binding protein
MTFTHRIAIAAIAAGTIFTLSAAAQAEIKYGVAAEPYAPFTSKDASGTWVGWEIDLMSDLCARMGEQCTLVEVAWDGIIPSLTSKQIDMIVSSMSITEERKKTINFSDMYYDPAATIIGAKNGDTDITPEHLSGKVLGVQVATTHAKYAEKFFVPAGATVKTYATQNEVNADLAAGRLDYVQADGIALIDWLATEAGACCELKGVAPRDAETLGSGVGAGIRKEDTALLEKMNAAIKAAAADGALVKITEKNGLAGKLNLPK